MLSLSNGGGGTLSESMMGFMSLEHSSNSSHSTSSESHSIHLFHIKILNKESYK